MGFKQKQKDDEFFKHNDYTLRVESYVECELRAYSNDKSPGVYSYHKTTRSFNFLAQELTEINNVTIFRSDEMSSTQTCLKTSFNNAASSAEIILMHQKLIDLKGNPPALDVIFPPSHVSKKQMPPVLGNNAQGKPS